MKRIIKAIESNTIAHYGFESRITRTVFRATEIERKITKRG